MRVRCTRIRASGVRYDLSARAEYEVLGIEAGDYRLIGDDGSPYLYPPALFRIVDPTRPRQWTRRIIDGQEYSYARPLRTPGFFEDYFDQVPSARRRFHRYLNQHLRLTRAA